MLKIFGRFIFLNLAKLLSKNKTKERVYYPQLWYCWPWFMKRRNPRLFKIRTDFCKFFTGHEISNTEWGYGGGNFVDRHCRWCDELIRVPKQEDDPPNDLIKGVAEDLGF